MPNSNVGGWGRTVGTIVLTALLTNPVAMFIQDRYKSGERLAATSAEIRRAQESAERADMSALRILADNEEQDREISVNAREISELRSQQNAQFAEVLRHLQRLDRGLEHMLEIMEKKWPRAVDGMPSP